MKVYIMLFYQFKKILNKRLKGVVIMSRSTNSYLSNMVVSKNNEEFYPDSASKGAVSRWLEIDNARMRVVVYPSGYEADHVCYQGHAFYVVLGHIKIKIDNEVTEWNEGDAFIIPDDTPHVVFNPNKEEAKVIVVDRG
ncbi:cupin domain-containing protein [Lentibacillus sp. N15]|uniref:cupin domain-containing protein n=1 Tax=Lentibacillus songyuanensis TaxID=3136161 RepID=UPI0031BB254E